MREMSVRFLGTTACIPDKNEDSPVFIVNQKYIFDTGWALPINLIKNNINVKGITHLFFTHMHQDHYISLPSFLFYLSQSDIGLDKLTILGPEYECKSIVKKACEFAQCSMPKVITLKEDIVFETEDMIFETHASFHAIPGLCYKLINKADGRKIGITGDTAFSDELLEFFEGCDALIHEISLGITDKLLESEILCGHSSVNEAVKTAKQCGIKKLFFVHHSRAEENEYISFSEKKGYKNSVWPKLGKEYTVE